MKSAFLGRNRGRSFLSEVIPKGVLGRFSRPLVADRVVRQGFPEAPN